MLDRKEVLEQAVHDCFKEMYAKAQPSVDWDQLVEDHKSGKYTKDDIVIDRYYLSHEEFTYILNKYKDAYCINSTWKPCMDLLIEYLSEGGSKDVYIKEKKDKNGIIQPSHRGYKKVPPIQTTITKIINSYDLSDKDKQSLIKKINKVIFNNINDCKNFYSFDKEESDFNFTVALGPSPTGDPERVKKYWESVGKPITIEERNPLLFWEYDYYGDDMDEIMTNEYGENWKEIWDKKWKDEQAKKKEEAKKRMERLMKQINKEDKKQK